MSGARIGKYEVLKSLGEGTSAKVKLCVNTETGEKVAIKIIKKSLFDTKADFKRKIMREIALMRFLEHPHIIRLHEVFESTNHLYMILEYAQNGELYDYLVARRFLKPDTAMKFFRQIIYGIDFLHSNSICHRDLKPENILLDENNNLKIADFGFARWMKTNTAITSCGSPHYAAPEVVKGAPYDGRAADVWSSGVILYALLAGYLPFDDPSIRNVLAKVKSGVFTFPDTLRVEPIKDLIRHILVVDVSQRLTIDQIKMHPAFHLYLPEGYEVPYPLPAPNISEPVENDDPRFYSLLRNIGYESDDQIKEELQANYSTAAKIFNYMYFEKQNLKNLPWASSIRASIAAKPKFSLNLENFMFHRNESPLQIGSFDTAPSMTVGSSPYQSFKESTKWNISLMDDQYYGDDDDNPDIKMYTFEPRVIQQLVLVRDLQKEFAKNKYDYFFPDDMSFIIHQNEQESYYTLSVLQKGQNETYIYIEQAYGTPEELEAFIKMINTLLSKYPLK